MHDKLYSNIGDASINGIKINKKKSGLMGPEQDYPNVMNLTENIC